jgi:cytoskeletal protein CcmA (bactofilin family)
MEKSPMTDTRQTIIENGTEFDGSIRSECGITIRGKLTGELEAPTLTVTDSGCVHGQVAVTELRSAGEISGEIDADVVELAGSVNDQTVINARTLEVKLNNTDGVQVTFGNCKLNVGERENRSRKRDVEVVVENDVSETEDSREPAGVL